MIQDFDLNQLESWRVCSLGAYENAEAFLIFSECQRIFRGRFPSTEVWRDCNGNYEL